MRKSSSPRDIPPPLELECLKALWRIGHGTVKDVRGIVTENRNLAYTTVMTVLDRLVKRGRVERRKQGRSFLYTPLVGKQELRRLAVQTLIDSFFDGSREELLAFLGHRPEPMPEPAPAIEPEQDQPMEPELL